MYLSYTALRQDEIRLVCLSPGVDDEPILCDLIHSGQGGEEYEALSYMWGPPSPSQTINLNGAAWSVRQNLFAALQSLRHQQEKRLLWVDALCINQDDISERSAQVAIMSRIYRAATKVLVWLGPASSDSHAAFGYVADFMRWRQAVRKVSDMISVEQEIAFMSVLERDYWRRVWIIQEILSAQEAEICCGTDRIPLNHFLQALSGFEAGHDQYIVAGGIINDPRPSGFCLSTPGAKILLHWRSPRHRELEKPVLQQTNAIGAMISASLELINLIKLSLSLKSECQDVRDRIYALVSVARDLSGLGTMESHFIEPDYSKSPAQLSVDAFLFYHNFVNLDGDTSHPYTSLSKLESLGNWHEKLQKLLGIPYWNEDLQGLESLHAICRPGQLSRLNQIALTSYLKIIDRVIDIGPIKGADCDLFSADWQHRAAPIFQFTDTNSSWADWAKNMNFDIRLSTVTYWTDHESSRTNTLDIDFALQDDGFYHPTQGKNAKDSEQATSSISTGQCRTFITTIGPTCRLGVASCDIRQGDILCQLEERNLERSGVIIRVGEDSPSFTLIGRAFFESLDAMRERTIPDDVYALNSALTPNERWTDMMDSKIPCVLDGASLFYLTR